MTEVTEKPEDVLEGEVQTPNARTKNFHNAKQVAEFLFWTNPSEFSVQTGRDETGSIIYQLKWKEL